jgi:glycosyltransferase 2 family protein
VHHRIRARVRRRLLGAIRAVIGLGVLAYVVSLVNLPAFRPVLEPKHVVWTVCALACLGANVYVAAWRWQLLLIALGVHERIAPLLRAIYVGAFYNLVLPGQLGGQAIKVMLVGRRSPALPAIVASVAMDQVLVIIALFLLAEVTTAFAPPVSHRTGWAIGFGIPLVLAVLLLLFSVNPRLQERLRARARRSRWLLWLPDGLRHQTGTTWRALTSYGHEPLLLLIAIGQAVLFLLTLGGMAFFLSSALGINLNPITMMFVLVLALVAGVAPFTLAGLGTREAVFTAALAQFGIARATGAAFAVLWLLLNSLADVVGGAMQLWHPRQTGTLERPGPRHPPPESGRF